MRTTTRKGALAGVAMLVLVTVAMFWGRPIASVSKIEIVVDKIELISRDRQMEHQHLVVSWKMAMHFIDVSNSSNTTCRLCKAGRLLPPLPNNTSLEQLWNCSKQQDSNKLSETQQKKMPSTVILGAQKGGTTTLSAALFSHPDIVTSKKKELHFFHSKWRFQNGLPDDQVRIRYQTILRNNRAKRAKKTNATHFMDATPIYVFLSSRVPYWLLCTAPWVKAIVVLRNPVDRAYSHFNMEMQRGGLAKRRMDFEEWIAMDFLQLKKAGVIRSLNSTEEFDAFSGSTEELHAWDKYLRETSEHAPIGRGLYALQLRHWQKAFEHFQKPPSDLLVLQSEKMKTGRDEVHRQVLDHVGLDYHPYVSEDTHVRAYKRPMANETRAMLMNFFKPYNQQLVDILGDDWDGVWDSN
eukprot:scaffold2256_cov166-Amphora_coffeaeformis.AAC.22